MHKKKISIVVVLLLILLYAGTQFTILRIEVNTTGDFETIGIVELTSDRRQEQQEVLSHLQSKRNTGQEVDDFIGDQFEYEKPDFFKPSHSQWSIKKRGVYLLYQRSYGESYIGIVETNGDKFTLDKSHRVDESR